MFFSWRSCDIRSGCDHRITLIFLVKQYHHTRNAQHDVLQEFGLVTQIGMLGARVYNDHIIGRDVQHFAFDIEMPS